MLFRKALGGHVTVDNLDVGWVRVGETCVLGSVPRLGLGWTQWIPGRVWDRFSAVRSDLLCSFRRGLTGVWCRITLFPRLLSVGRA